MKNLIGFLCLNLTINPCHALTLDDINCLTAVKTSFTADFIGATPLIKSGDGDTLIKIENVENLKNAHTLITQVELEGERRLRFTYYKAKYNAYGDIEIDSILSHTESEITKNDEFLSVHIIPGTRSLYRQVLCSTNK